MNYKRVRLVSVILAVLLLAFPGLADQTQKKRKAASLDGTTGLFHVWDAETLRQGEFNFSLGYDHYNRDPGELVIKSVPVSGAVGVHDRVEIFGGMDVQKHIREGSLRTYRLLPGELPQPAQVLGGRTLFTNDAPFMDVPVASGRGNWNLGAKVNLLSERLGNPLSLGLVGFVIGPPGNNVQYLNRGLTTGQFQGGFGGLISKRAGNIAQVHFNMLLNYVGDPKISGVKLADLQNEFIYKGGAAFPAYGRVQLIAELDGKTYYGDRTVGANPRSPVDLLFGLRAFFNDYVSASMGYRASLNHVKEDQANQIFPAGTNGMVAQLAFGSRVNEPPSVTCAIANSSIKQDEKTTIRVNATDPDGDPLSYSWTSSGGKVEGSGDTVTFDATGIAPGEYTITVTVSDGKHQVPCSVKVTVIKKNLPPTVNCSPTSTTITLGESATVTATASDPNNDRLTYSWTVNGEKIAADTPSISFGSSGRQPGNYTITVTVSDGEFTASCSSTVTVKEPVKVNQPPRIECLTTSVDTFAGNSVELKVKASDPDNDPLTISWSATGGSVTGSGETATYNSTGVKAGIYTVTATADDGRGGKASCTMTVTVSERISLGAFAPGGYRVDNVMKAALDDLAVRMKNDTRLYANVIGYTDGSKSESRMKGLGAKRAQAVVNYLKKKGVDASRLTVTDGDGKNLIGDVKTAAGRKMNRRVEIELSVK